jgi:hypothetical protein
MRKLVLALPLALGAFGCSHSCPASAAQQSNYANAASQQNQPQRQPEKPDYAPLP